MRGKGGSKKEGLGEKEVMRTLAEPARRGRRHARHGMIAAADSDGERREMMGRVHTRWLALFPALIAASRLCSKSENLRSADSRIQQSHGATLPPPILSVRLHPSPNPMSYSQPHLAIHQEFARRQRSSYRLGAPLSAFLLYHQCNAGQSDQFDKPLGQQHPTRPAMRT